MSFGSIRLLTSRSFTHYFQWHSVIKQTRTGLYHKSSCLTSHPVPLRYFSHTITDKSRRFVLGIETSCDDTGAAVVDNDGNIIGEAINSQTAIHNQTGGIIPNIARELHEKNVKSIVTQALENANMTLNEMDAVAVTVEPGLIISLRVGMTYAVQLAKSSGIPLIPIHHMEAHALTARMIEKVEFPFLVLLASGGHCLLAVARDIDDFLLLGTSCDIAPGDAYDKTARALKLWCLPQFNGVSGGAAVEQMAREGDYKAFPSVHVRMKSGNCNFSFAGLKTAADRKIREEYKRLNLPETEVLPNASDICAWFQYNITHHLCRKLQRAFMYSEINQLLGDKKTLVVSGGVASNSYIRACLERVCTSFGCQIVCPPPKLCTDNGIMIAWNGMEKLLSGVDFSEDPDTVDVTARSPLGEDMTEQVANCKIKLPKLNLHGT